MALRGVKGGGYVTAKRLQQLGVDPAAFDALPQAEQEQAVGWREPPSLDAAQYTNGLDAAFKRISANDGTTTYRSDNGLTVKFHKSGSWMYANIYHTDSQAILKSLSNAPVKNQRDVLNTVRTIGSRYNFRLSRQDIEAMPEKIRNALYKDLTKLKQHQL